MKSVESFTLELLEFDVETYEMRSEAVLIAYAAPKTHAPSLVITPLTRRFDKTGFLSEPLFWLKGSDSAPPELLSLTEWLSALKTYLNRMNASFIEQGTWAETPGGKAVLEGLKRQESLSWNNESWLKSGLILRKAGIENKSEDIDLSGIDLSPAPAPSPPLVDFSECGLSPDFGKGLPLPFVKSLERALIDTESFCTSLPLKAFETERSDELFVKLAAKLHPELSDEALLMARLSYLKHERALTLDGAKARLADDPAFPVDMMEEIEKLYPGL